MSRVTNAKYENDSVILSNEEREEILSNAPSYEELYLKLQEYENLEEKKMLHLIKWKAGDKIDVLNEDGEWEPATIASVSYTSYLMFNETDFVLAIIYVLEKDTFDMNYKIIGEKEINERIRERN